MNKTLTIAGLGAAIAGTLSLLPAAQAAGGGGLQAGKDRCTTAIDNRHGALAALDADVRAASNLSDPHRATITATIAATGSGLDGLVPTIDAATDRTGLMAACHPITVDYRVYVLVVPQSKLAIGFDADAGAVATLDAIAAGADGVIAAEKDAGKDTSAAEATLASLRTETAAITSDIDGKADGVLALEPAGWNADHAVLAPYRESLRSALGHVKAARDLARQLGEELKA